MVMDIVPGQPGVGPVIYLLVMDELIAPTIIGACTTKEAADGLARIMNLGRCSQMITVTPVECFLMPDNDD